MSKCKGLLTEVKMGHFLHLKKEALNRDEKGTYDNGKWAFVDGKKALIRF